MTSMGNESIASKERYTRGINKALLSDLLNRISGENTDLVKFDEVANRLRARQRVEMGTENVPLDKIVGSVGRYKDFTREYLPRPAVNKERWARVDEALHSMEGLPPIDLYRIGDAYFVRDGNHRVSVARANGLDTIEAYVTEYKTDVALTADDFDRDKWIIKIEQAEFLEETGLNRFRPESSVEFTEPGRYWILTRHINVHMYLRNQDFERSGQPERLDWEGAVESWYDNVYMPMVEAIRTKRLLEQFPGRTEADLYVWVAHHREQIATLYELAPLTPDAAVSTFAETHSEGAMGRTVQSIKKGLHMAMGNNKRPMGMSEEEYQDGRARHDAGEISIREADDRREADASSNDAPEEPDKKD